MEAVKEIKIFALAAALILINLAGCSQERFYEGIYEGVRMQDEAERKPAELDSDRMPGYDEYKKERQQVIKGQQDTRML